MLPPCTAGLDCITGQPAPPLYACLPPSMYDYMPPPAFYFNSSSQFNSSPGLLPNLSYSMPPTPWLGNGSLNGSWAVPMQEEPLCDPTKAPKLSSQGRALVAWRDSMRASNNPALANWGLGDPCAFVWGGVTCENGTVVGLSLAQPSMATQGMSGPDFMGIRFTYAQGPLDWQVLTNLTGLRTLELQVGSVMWCWLHISSLEGLALCLQ